MDDVAGGRENVGEPVESPTRTASLAAAIRAARVEVADRAHKLVKHA